MRIREWSTERSLIVESEEAAQISAVLPGWRIESIPLFPAGDDHGCVCVASDDGRLALVRFSRGVLLRGATARSQIGLLLNDPSHQGARILARPLTAGVALMLGPLADLDVFLPGRCALMFVSAPIGSLDLGSAPGPGAREFRALPDALHRKAIELSQLLMQGRGESARAGRDQSEDRRTLCESLLREAAPLPNHAPVQSVRHVAVIRACSHMDAHLGESISLDQLCEVAGARPRTLEYGFREFYDVGPMTYLRCMRLYRTRRELLGAQARNVSVTTTARRWRFSHMGQFSRDYRLLFGENPSTTLARALSIRASAVT